ncbi:MAG: helix-turn-helix transcriptional regulator [Halopseudomonas aestusnigri]
MTSTPQKTPSPKTNKSAMLWGLLVIQIVCTLFFLADALGDMIFAGEILAGFSHDILESMVVLAMSLSIVFTITQIRRMLHRQRRMEDQIKIASGAFVTMLNQYFDSWKLTPSERDVALFLIKGMSFSDIANMRNTKEGTVKAQCNAIYTKSDVTGRAQLLSFFIEELLSEELIPEASRV